MAENEIEETLDHLRRIKSGGNLSIVKIEQIEKLEMVLRVFRTFRKYQHVLLPDPAILTKNAKLTVKALQQVLSTECKTNHNLERLDSDLSEFLERGTILSDNSELNDFDLSECMDCLGKNLNDVPMMLLERLESHLLEFLERDTILSYNYELNDFDLSECMDCLGKILNDVLMMLLKRVRSDPPEENLSLHKFIRRLKIIQKKMRFLRYLYATEINGYVDNEKLVCLETRIQIMADNVGQLCLGISVNDIFVDDKAEDDTYEHEYMNKPPYLLCLIVLVELEMKKIFLSELKASKFTQSKTFKDKKLPKGFSHHLHSLLMYLRNKKLENFPSNISAQNMDVAIEFLLVFLDADESNHVINGNWLNEVMEKVRAIVGDVIYVIQKLLPSSINKDETSKITFCSIQILEKTKDLKAQVETYYKSLKFTPSQYFPTIGGLSFLDSLLRKLNELSKSKSGLDFLMKPLLGNLEKELSSHTSILEKELSSLSSIFRDVAKVHHEHKILKVLQRRTVNFVYEAELAIDSVLAQYNTFLHIFCSLPTILKEIKQINAEVTEIWSVDVALKPHYVVAPSKHPPTQHSNPVNDEEIVGFENDTEKMILNLIRGTNELDIVPIVGMGGQGKTTIARKVFTSDNIVSHFDVRAWCIVSQTYNRRNLLQEIFSQVTGSKDMGDKEDELADMLRKRLMGKRYLIVLDDMWDCMAWDYLRRSFPDVGNRSRILVTTRLEKVGHQVKYHTDPYCLPFLTTEESCKLLQKKVFQKEDCPPELQDVSHAVAEKCKGLPLVVVLVAGIIKKRKIEESWWNEVKDALFDYLDRESEEYSRKTMQLSFDNLPDCLKPCLLYMGMFPEDARISASKLISLWTAEGFVQNIESAEDYLMDLISSNVVMVSRRRYNGKVKDCRVHDVVLHFCLEKSREEKFMLAVKGHARQFQPLDWKGSRVSFSFSGELSKFASLGSKIQKPSQQHLRSLITTNRGESIYGFLLCQISELRLLKVLDLSSHEVCYLSSATFKPLNHLKYLAVWAYKFYFHPDSHMPRIETLIVDYNENIVVLPESFWEMEKLRCLCMAKAEFDKHGFFEGSSKLENLRILVNVRFPIEEVDRVDVLLQRCLNLQQLQIEFQGIYPLWYTSEESFCLTLENLTQLQILHLSFGNPLHVSRLQLPSNLKKLVLLFGSASMISFIARLPNLEYLKLELIYFMDDKIRSSEEWCLRDITFHKLKILKLVKLCISRWDASAESFPLLERLFIRGCMLEEIPLSFADIPNLKQIKLAICNESLKDSAVRIKEEAEYIEGCDRIDLIIY